MPTRSKSRSNNYQEQPTTTAPETTTQSLTPKEKRRQKKLLKIMTQVAQACESLKCWSDEAVIQETAFAQGLNGFGEEKEPTPFALIDIADQSFYIDQHKKVVMLDPDDELNEIPVDKKVSNIILELHDRCMDIASRKKI